MKKHSIYFLVILIFVIATVIYALKMDSTERLDNSNIYDSRLIVKDVYTDKSMYNPGDTVKVTVVLENTIGYDINEGIIELQARHLNLACGEKIVKDYTLSKK